MGLEPKSFGRAAELITTDPALQPCSKAQRVGLTHLLAVASHALMLMQGLVHEEVISVTP